MPHRVPRKKIAKSEEREEYYSLTMKPLLLAGFQQSLSCHTEFQGKRLPNLRKGKNSTNAP